MENKTVSVGRWQYSEPAFEADENGHIVICSKSSVAPAEFFEWGIDAEKRPFERYRCCENDFYEEAKIDYTIILTLFSSFQSLSGVNGSHLI